MSGDYEWSDMPEELALQLYDLANANLEESTTPEDLQEWLLNEMRHCAATKEVWPRLHNICPDLPVPGSEFCPKHMPKEDIDAGD